MEGKGKLIGLAGRASSGKSTVANYLAPDDQEIILETYNNPWAYMISVLFDIDYSDLVGIIPISKNEVYIEEMLDDQIIYNHDKVGINGWKMFEWTLNVLKILNEDILIFLYDNSRFKAPTPTSSPINNSINNRSKQLSFADPLKKICTAISGIDYKILLGNDASSRKFREQPIINFNNKFFDNKMTGRQLLEILGTNCFRSTDPEIWIDLASRDIKRLLTDGYTVVLSDVRFTNEFDMLVNHGGELFVTCKSKKDLILTNEDKETHCSKWEFLTFINESNCKIIINDGTLEELYKKISDN